MIILGMHTGKTGMPFVLILDLRIQDERPSGKIGINANFENICQTERM